MADKYFDRREAEELLRTIVPWLEEARDEKQRVDEYKNELARIASRIMILGGTFPPLGDLLKKKTQHDQSAEHLEEIVSRIQDVGVVVKDLDMGLVDFPSLQEGEEIYLCWKLGEEHIAFWHGLDEGYAGRKPLDEPGPEHHPPQGPRLQ